MYFIDFGENVVFEIKKLEKSGDKIALKKLYFLLEELKSNPKTGTGKPEQLKYFEKPTFSRRISDKHRLVYEINEEAFIFNVLSIWGHYEDK